MKAIKHLIIRKPRNIFGGKFRTEVAFVTDALLYLEKDGHGVYHVRASVTTVSDVSKAISFGETDAKTLIHQLRLNDGTHDYTAESKGYAMEAYKHTIVKEDKGA